MRFAICNEHWGRAPFEKVCEDAAACGYQGLELAPFTLKEDPRELTVADAIRLTRIAHSFGLEIIGLHWLLTKPAWLHITTPDALLRAEAMKFGTGFADRLHTKTLWLARRRLSATRLPMMPKPRTPTSLLFAAMCAS